MKINVEDREIIIKYRKNKYQRDDIYNRICENTMGINLNEIHIKYEIKNEDNNLRIFGDIFIENNYNNYKIIINGKVSISFRYKKNKNK